MDEISQRLIETIKNYINDIKKHIKVNKVVLYGSYAKGNYNKDSDIDLAVFSDSFKDKKFVEITSFLFRFARKHKEYCIEPIGFTTMELKGDNPFIKDILNTGKEIYPYKNLRNI